MAAESFELSDDEYSRAKLASTGDRSGGDAHSSGDSGASADTFALTPEEDRSFKEAQKPVSTDAYKQELSDVLADDSFWNQPYDKKVSQLRSLYLGDNKSGHKNFENEDEVLNLHRETLADIRAHDDIPVVQPEDYAKYTAPWPAQRLLTAKSSDEVASALDEWEANTLSTGKALGGLLWQENQELIEKQIADKVDATKRLATAQFNLPEGTGKLGQFLGNLSTGFKAFADQTLGMVPGTEKLLRKIDTSSVLPESQDILEGKVKVNIPLVGDVDAQKLIQGAGSMLSSAETALIPGGLEMAGHARAAYLAGAALMTGVARNGYAQGYDAVLSKTGSREKAIKAGWMEAPIEAADFIFDASVARGLISKLTKNIPNPLKIDVLAKLTESGALGAGLRSGFKTAATVTGAALAEGGEEVVQDYAEGKVEAGVSGDPSLERGKDDLAVDFLAGAVGGAGLGAHGHEQVNRPELGDHKGLELDVSAPDFGEADTTGAETGKTQEATQKQVSTDVNLKGSTPSPVSPRPETAPAITEDESGKITVEPTQPQPTTAAEINTQLKEKPAPAPTKTEDGEPIVKSPETTKKSEGILRTALGKEIPFERVYLPKEEVTVQKDIPNFKKGADPVTGIVGEPSDMGTKFEPAKAQGIFVLEKDVTGNGEKEILTGRHKFYIANNDESVKNIPALLVKESDGMTIADAKLYDAEINIAEGSGEVQDYAKFFDEAKIPIETAREQGIYKSRRAQEGYKIGTYGSEELKAAYFSDRLSDKAAALIAEAAPNNTNLQRVGLDQIIKKKASPHEAVEQIKIIRDFHPAPNESQQDMFGVSDKAMQDSARLAKAATELQQQNQDELTLLSQARNLSGKELSNVSGISDELKSAIRNNNPAPLEKEISRLQGEKDRWREWRKFPDLKQQVQERAQGNLKKGEQIGLDLTKLQQRTEPAPNAKPNAEGISGANEGVSETTGPARTAPNENVRQVEPAATQSTPEEPVSKARKNRAKTEQALQKSHREELTKAESRLEELKAKENPTDAEKELIPKYEKNVEGLKKRVEGEKTPDLGTSAVAASQFAESKKFEKVREQTADAIERGAPEEQPLLPEVYGEIEKQEVGQYLKTTERERQFFAERYLQGKDSEELARDITNANGTQPLAELPEDVAGVVVGNVYADIQKQLEAARAAGNEERLNDLKLLSAELYLTAQNHGTGAAKALQANKQTNRLMGIANADDILRHVEETVNRGNKGFDAQTQREIMDAWGQREKLAKDENALSDQGAQVELREQELRNLKDQIDARKAEFNERKQELKDRRAGLEQQEAKLERAGKRQETQSANFIEKLKSQIAELEKRIPELEQKLQDSQERFEKVKKKLSQDIKDFKKMERALTGERKKLYKRELELRQKRATQRERLIFKTLPEKAQGELKALVGKYEEARPGSANRVRIASRMVNIGFKYTKLTPAEVLNIIWYANAVSGLSTQGINFFGNGMSFFYRSLGYLARNPNLASYYFQGLVSGMGKGWTEGANIFREGRASRTDLEKFSPSMLEYMQQDGSVLEHMLSLEDKTPTERIAGAAEAFKENPVTETLTGLGIGKATGRMLRAADAFWYRSAFDAMAAAELARQGKLEGLSDQEIATRVSDGMYLSSENGKRALVQAKEELEKLFGDDYSERDLHRTAFELLDSQLPPAVREEGDRWGSLITYTQPLEGVFGSLGTAINNLAARWTIQTKIGPVRLLQPFFPFVNIVANVAETGLEFFPPSGFLKAKYQPSLTPERRIEVATNAIVGSVMTMGLVGLAAAFQDDDNPYFTIYGSLEALPKSRRDELRNNNQARPFTFKIGEHLVPYMETPLYWMSMFGSYFDNRRFNKKFDETTGQQFIKMLMGGFGKVFLNQASLKALGDMMSIAKGERDVTDLPASYLSIFLPGGIFAKDLDRIFSNQFEQPVPSDKHDVISSFTGAFFKNYPAIGSLINKPALNGFGEEIQPGVQEGFGFIRRTIGTWRKGDAGPEWDFLSQHDLTFAGFQNAVQIGTGQGKAEKYSHLRLAKTRGELVGRAYFNVFTPSEKYELVQIAGPMIKQAVHTVMENSQGKTRVALQEEIDKAVTKAKSNAKARLVSILLSRYVQ